MVAMPKGDRRVSMVLENETEKVWITQDPSPCDGTHASVWQLGQSGMSTWAQSQRVSFVMHPSLVAILKTLLMFKVYGDMTKSKLLTSPLGQLWDQGVSLTRNPSLEWIRNHGSQCRCSLWEKKWSVLGNG
jgi:hypothetical protein